LIENTAMLATGKATKLVQEAYHEICSKIGVPILLDAARVGSYSHRLRNYWTNLAPINDLQAALDSIHRDPNLSLSDILEKDFSAPLCRQAHQHPWYPVNSVGKPLAVLPTLVAKCESYAFRLHSAGTGAGLILYKDGTLHDLSLREREQALGYQPFLCQIPEFSFEQCHALLGRAFDINAVHAILSTSLAIRMPCIIQAPIDIPLQAMATVATIEESIQVNPLRDAWEDQHLISYLQLKAMPAHVLSKERKRIMRRASSYKWTDDQLFRIFVDGTLKKVPKPQDRVNLIQSIHESVGHFGHRRTTQQVLLSHWWTDIYQDVRSVCRRCMACDQSHASFNAMQPQLQPLPIKGLFYRWGIDLAGPFPSSNRGNTYIMVCIEHFSKWVEVFPLQGKTASEVAYYAHQLFSRYLSPAEVVTDGGGEFEGAFHELLIKLGVDHRVTSPNHPQANGLAERMVGTIKRSLKRLFLVNPDHANWDLHVPWIVMGYVVTPQAASKISPYQALFAVPPIIPPSIRERIDVPVNFDDQELCAQSILLRAALMQKDSAISGHNQLIAQHKDTQRYARLRSGGYVPLSSPFFNGQYVYVTKNRGKSRRWETKAESSRILRVVDARSTGVLVLIGSCGKTVRENSVNCSPCHLPMEDIAPGISSSEYRPSKDHHCAICGFPNRPSKMLICDACTRGFHIDCIGLKSVPKGSWLCSSCAPSQPLEPSTLPNSSNIQSTDITAVAPQRRSSRTRKAHSVMSQHFDTTYWDNDTAKSMDGERIQKAFDGELYNGTVSYIGYRLRPWAFLITYEDGDAESMCLAEVLHYHHLPSS
jgi:hypothetical protein